MDFYFYFVCVIIIPTFSTGNDDDTERLESILNKIRDNEGKSPYPLAAINAHLAGRELCKHAINGKISMENLKKVEKQTKLDFTTFRQILSSIIKSDIPDSVECIATEIMIEFFQSLIPYEIYVHEKLYDVDKNTTGTVTKECAREIISQTKLFSDNLSSNFIGKVLDKYSNEENQFNYKEMIENLAKDYANNEL